MEIKSNGLGITNVEFTDAVDKEHEDKFIFETKKQLNEYFKKERQNFNLNLITEGTEFEKEVWSQLLNIPYGFTTNYGNIAAKLGNKKLAQAVGHANGKNPIAVIIPCHRVIGSNNNLTGYAGGIERKKWLLKHEGSILF